jgi:hypothetical protein
MLPIQEHVVMSFEGFYQETQKTFRSDIVLLNLSIVLETVDNADDDLFDESVSHIIPRVLSDVYL